MTEWLRCYILIIGVSAAVGQTVYLSLDDTFAAPNATAYNGNCSSTEPSGTRPIREATVSCLPCNENPHSKKQLCSNDSVTFSAETTLPNGLYRNFSVVLADEPVTTSITCFDSYGYMCGIVRSTRLTTNYTVDGGLECVFDFGNDGKQVPRIPKSIQWIGNGPLAKKIISNVTDLDGYDRSDAYLTVNLTHVVGKFYVELFWYTPRHC